MVMNPKGKTRRTKSIDAIVGGVVIHGPHNETGKWWIREDVTTLLREPIDDALMTLDSLFEEPVPGVAEREFIDPGLRERLTVSVHDPILLIQADTQGDIVAIARWIAQYSDPSDRQNWRTSVAIEPGAARLRRPVVEVPATFEGVLERWGHVSRSHVPIEAVRPGDKQVVAARYPPFSDPPPADPYAKSDWITVAKPVISLDALADFPDVVSVIAATPVEARRPLPSIRELLVLHYVVMPDATTLANLPGLETFLNLVPSSKLDLDAFPVALRRLALSATCIDRFDLLGRLTNLEELRLFNCYRHSLKALGALTKLRCLHIDGETRMSAWKALRDCVLLEEAYLGGLKADDLRAFQGWTKLRYLGVSKRGLRSLDGIQAFAALEELALGGVAIDDLTSLAGHQKLHTVMLYGTDIHDLGPLAELPRLRRLEIRMGRKELHVRSLRPLARCESLESVCLEGTIVDDAHLASLADLPKLKELKIANDDGRLARAISSLRRARPDLDIHYTTSTPAPEEPEEKVGDVVIHPPAEGMRVWSIFDDLTEVFEVLTNYDAEKKLRRALAAEDRSLLKRLEFDTEGEAVAVYAKGKGDIRRVAKVINRLAASR